MPLNVESYAEPEVAVAAVVVAAVVAPPVRRTVRRGLIYGLAGTLLAFDKASAVVHGAALGVSRGVSALRKQSTETVVANAPPPPAPAPV
jgi:hypothetical protein